MALLSLKKLKFTISPELSGKHVLRDYALGGQTISYGWYDSELGSLLQGVRSSLFTENPSTVFKFTCDVIPLSYDDRLLTSIINNGKMNGTQAFPAMFENQVDGLTVMSDECYILSTADTQLQQSPSGKTYTFILVNAVTKNPNL